MRGLQVLVLYNLPARQQVKGRPEDAVSEAGVLAAVEAVSASLRELGAEPRAYGVGPRLRGLLDTLARRRPDVVFNLCEGIGGEASFEYLIPGLLELEGLAYTGASARTLVGCADKVRTKRLLASQGVPTPAFLVVEQGEATTLPPGLDFPLIVKPAHEDASLGIDAASVVHDGASLGARVALVHELYRQPALVERYIEGREFNLSVLGNAEPRTLPLAEISFDGLPDGHPRIVSYEAKWVEDSPVYTGTPSVCPAPGVDEALAGRIAAIARRAYRLMECTGYGRVDLRVPECGEPQVLEVNPNPDLSPDAGLAKAGRASGLGYTGLIRAIVEAALERHRSSEAPRAGAVETQRIKNPISRTTRGDEPSTGRIRTSPRGRSDTISHG